MPSSSGFGSTNCTSRPIKTRFRFAFANQLKLGSISKSQDHASIGTPLPCSKHRAVTACKHTVSGSLSLPSRGAFHLSLTVLFHYRSVGIFSLTGWSPLIHARFHVTHATQVLAKPPRFSPTGFSPSLIYLSRIIRLNARVYIASPTTPASVEAGLGSSTFVRHYSRNRVFFPLL